MKYSKKDFEVVKMVELPTESKEGARHRAAHNDIYIDVFKLINLTNKMPTEMVKISDLVYGLKEDSWNDQNGKKINQIDFIKKYEEVGSFYRLAEEYPELEEHSYKTFQSDYTHPILIYQNRVLDGKHRLVKAIINKEVVISARLLNDIPHEARIEKYF